MYKKQKVLAIILARSQSQRLKDKMFLPFAGHKTVIESVINRVKSSRLIDHIVLATSDNEQDHVFHKISEQTGIDIFFGSENDVVSRMIGSLKSVSMKPDIIVRVCADNPLLMPSLVDEGIEELVDKKGDVISLGHRNPQGLYYSKKFDFILSTEHGPKGGDEININHKPFLKIKNFGWPISSYGDHYKKNYSEKILSEAPLNNSHKKYGFEEPIKYFDPSIGISEVIPFNEDESEFLIGAMGNEIKDQDLGIHYIKLDKKRIKIINHKFIPLNERVRDMIVSKDKKTIVIFLETTSSLAVFKKNS